MNLFDRIYPCVQNFQIAVGISKSQFRNIDFEFPNYHSQYWNTFPNVFQKVPNAGFRFDSRNFQITTQSFPNDLN